MEEDNLISLLNCATNLEYFNVGNSKKITNSLIDAAIEVTKNRSSNIVLKMCLNKFSSKNIKVDKIKEKSPLLHLSIHSRY